MTLNDIPTPYILALCAIFGLAAALLCVVLGRGAWRWWRRRKVAAEFAKRPPADVAWPLPAAHPLWFEPRPPRTSDLYPQDFGEPMLEYRIEFVGEPEPFKPSDIADARRKLSRAAPYKPQGGPVPNAPVTRAEFDALLHDITRYADGGTVDEWFVDVWRRLERLERLDSEINAALSPATEPASGIRVFGGPIFFWLRDLAEGEEWNVSKHPELGYPELHGAEKARVIADWRKATNA